MAYFLPSYFQKRLLRYALSRLDFIDSDALDLDNLDLTIGQRSVIELKNVGIKVSKLVEQASIPSIIVLKSATIQILRITIPADLHVSGIEVDIDGVNVETQLDYTKQEDEADERPQRGHAPSHKDIANKPRKGIKSIYDPGGRYVPRSKPDLSGSLVIPNTDDLAASFLEAEPEVERSQLQAAIESRSAQMAKSTLSVASSQGDTGVGEAFSLPGFVANFFAGVANRLCLKIRRINVSAAIVVDGESLERCELCRLVLDIDSLELSSLDTAAFILTAQTDKRSVVLRGITVYIESEITGGSTNSAFSSPRLAKGRSSDFENSGQDSGPPGLGLTDSILLSSQIFPSTRHLSDPGTTDSSPTLSRISSGQVSSSGDLAESQLFDHDTAASMYMSAVSTTQAPSHTPAAVHTSQITSLPMMGSALTEDRASPPSLVDVSRSARTSPLRQTPGERTLAISQNTGGKALRLKHLLRLDRAEIKLPREMTADARLDADEQSTSRTDRVVDKSRLQDSTTSLRMRVPHHHRNSSEQSTHIPSELREVQLDDRETYELHFGALSCFVDMGTCQALVKTWSRITSSTGTNLADQTSTADSVRAPNHPVKVHMEAVHVLMLEDVEAQSKPKLEGMTDREFSRSLLKLSFESIGFRSVLVEGVRNQKLSIHSLSLDRGDQSVISFLENTHMDESMMTSTATLNKHAVVVSRVDQRIDISTKPIRIVADLLTLDDVLSRSGGLESYLDLAASINSNGTVRSSRQSSVPSRKRSVRFEDPQPHRAQINHSARSLKVNMRIGAVVLELVGSESTMQLNTSAIKLVYRPSKLRTSISSINIQGPYRKGLETREALQVRVSNIEFTFLEVPEESDLERLLCILAPSNERNEEDDEIMVETLLRQRRKGSVVRLSLQELQINSGRIAWLPHISKLADEMAKLSAVTKYLPEDDKPGILMFILVRKVHAHIELGDVFGQLNLNSSLLEGVLISAPSLMSLQISTLHIQRNAQEAIVRELIQGVEDHVLTAPRMLTCRFIPEAMEPTVKLQLSNTCVEYSVPLLLAVTSLVDEIAASLGRDEASTSPQASGLATVSSEPSEVSRRVRLSVRLRSSAILLRPRDLPAAGLILFTEATVNYSNKPQRTEAVFEIKKGSLLIIDDLNKAGREDTGADVKLYFDQNDQVQELVKLGFVPVGSISSALFDFKITTDEILRQPLVDVEFRNNLFYLETCADSTQTLGQVFSGLSPPSQPSGEVKYRTQVVPIDDLLSSFTGAAFATEAEIDSDLGHDQVAAGVDESSKSNYSHDDDGSTVGEAHFDLDLLIHPPSKQHDQDRDAESTTQSLHGGMSRSMIEDDSMQSSVLVHSVVDLRDGHFQQGTSVGGTAHRWDAKRGTYELGNEALIRRSPLKVRVRDVHIIWNLFDGYDWQNTRDVISQAVRDLEDKAYARQNRRSSRRSPAPEEEDESVIGDVLFNSIYISIPTHKDPRDLVNAINMELGDAVSETGSYATSTTATATTTTRRGPNIRPKPKKLRLNRSKQHKMTFELEGVSADFIAFPPGLRETDSSLDIRVHNLDIFDHIPTSTWKKFATYMQEAGEREVGTDMIHVEVLNVKPVADLSASEIVLKMTVLPLRLHVDQDALDFLTRFFEFKDDRTPASGTASVPPFIQRAEVNPIRVRLDFKPKRVDYAALKSGRTTELMNFIVLDRSDMVLRRVILYGVSGFDRLGIMLNNIWTPDVRNNQLPGVLAGLAPVRSLVDVGSGVRDLIAVPIREYRKDGRLVRSIQRGAIAFAKTTTTELINLGAKLAIGTQQVLQDTEEALAPQRPGYDTEDDDPDSHRQISLYADQPLGIVQGLRGAYSSLERDLLLAKDAIVAVPGEVMANPSAAGAAKAVLKQAPTIILRPAIGVTKAAGQAFLGAGNTLDKSNRKRVEDVSTCPPFCVHTDMAVEIQAILNRLYCELTRIHGTVKPV